MGIAGVSRFRLYQFRISFASVPRILMTITCKNVLVNV
jgi:hypothetical protein